ncbi:MAG: hypothetical protein J6W22_02850 [Fibrobacter sp.]|nr:hypothetical protein [Fibrobacter sp.]
MFCIQIRNILFAVLCVCAFVFAQDKVNPAEMQGELQMRADLLQALKTGDMAKVDSALLVLSNEKIPESAIDSLEILQVNLIRGRYDLAVPQLANIFMKAGQKVRFSFANDSLFEYLRNETRFAAEYNDRPGDLDQRERLLKLKKYLTDAAQANMKQEYRDLASILVDLNPYYHFFDKEFWINLGGPSKRTLGMDSMANIVANRVESWVDFHQEMDTVAAKPMLERMRAFCANYPESEYSAWLGEKLGDIEFNQERYKQSRNYYIDKLYTGGLGFEAFIGNSWTYVIGVPIQFSWLIITPSYIGGKSSSSYRLDDGSMISDEGLDGFFVTVGFDVYENKWLKFQPFVGGIKFYTTGLQAEFRFWMSKTVGSEFHDAAYLSLKFRYMGIYHTAKTVTASEEDFEKGTSEEKEWCNKFLLGIGIHFW